MGLDMYLIGEKFFWTDWKDPKNNLMEDGFKVQQKELELGYWRKHPDLHGYIVQTFAGGNDNCEKILLSQDAILQIIQAVECDSLPHTEGFFFGRSAPEDKPETLKILRGAIDWLKGKGKGKESREVFYRASW